MKETQEFSAWLVRVSLICAALLLAAGCATEAPQTITHGAAKVVRLNGAGRFVAGDNTWQPLELGHAIKPGTVVQTALKADLDLALGDGSAENLVRMWENTFLVIDKVGSAGTGAAVVTETQLDLKAGHIFGMVKQMPAASRYEVKLPNGVAGIRGTTTTYDISAEGLIKVWVGSVVLAYAGPDGTVATQVIMGLQQFDSRTAVLSSIPDAGGNPPVLKRF